MVSKGPPESVLDPDVTLTNSVVIPPRLPLAVHVLELKLVMITLPLNWLLAVTALKPNPVEKVAATMAAEVILAPPPK